MHASTPLGVPTSTRRTLLDLGLTCIALSMLIACSDVQGDETASAAATTKSPNVLARIFSPKPEPIHVGAGTLLQVSMDDTVSSHESRAGNTFGATVTDAVVVGGRTAIPSGTRVSGTVTQADTPKIGGRAKLTLRFDSVTISGDSIPIDADFAAIGKNERLKDIALIGGGTIAGVVIGEEIHEGEGGIIGGIVGGVAGALGAKKTQGRPVVVSAGTELTLRLLSPLVVG